MKKILFAFAFSLIYCLAQAQSVDAIFKEFKNNQNAEYTDVPLSTMKDKINGKASEAIKSIKSIQVLNLKSCTPSDKEKFSQCIEKLSKNNYETIISVNEDNSKVKILGKKKKNYINELLVVCIETNECTLVYLDGKINVNDISKLVNINK